MLTGADLKLLETQRKTEKQQMMTKHKSEKLVKLCSPQHIEIYIYIKNANIKIVKK